jgi:Fe-S-cluster containining protein
MTMSKIDNLKAFVNRRYIKADNFIGTLNSCCSKGCNFCCYQSIETLNIERPVIHEYVRKTIKGEMFETVKNNLSDWFDYFDSNTPNKLKLNFEDVFVDFRNLSAKQSLKCPFLIAGLCSIYEMRPLTCRIHVVENLPQNCNLYKLRDSSPQAFEYRNSIKNEISRITDIHIMPLSYAISDIFLPKRKLKKIENRTI